MVKRLINFIHKEISGLHEAAYLLAVFAFVSQILALVRDRFLAHAFGASHTLDIYYAAFRIPDFIFVSIATMVSISVLVPFFIEKTAKNSGEGKEFIDQVFSVFFLSIMVISVIAFFLIPWLTPLVLPGFVNDPALPELIGLSRILLLSPLFLGFSNFLASITQIHNRFFLYAISPSLYNIGIIIGTVVLYPIFGIYGLGFGVIIGAVLHMGVQVPFIVSRGLFPRLTTAINFSNVKEVILLSFPRTLTLASNQISMFFLTAMASLMTSGSIAVFNFSYNLQSVPLSIIGVSYSSAAFPLLSRLFTSGDRKKFLEQMIASTQHIIFWSLPVMVLFIVLRAQIVRVVLGSGQFNWTDTRLTAAALAIFTLSVIPQSLMILFVRAFYSGGKTLKPLIINVISAFLTVVFGYGFMKLYELWPTFHYFIEALFKVTDVGGTSVLMLALAYSFGIGINTLFHWVAFQREYKGFSGPVLKSLSQVFGASVVMGYVSYKMLDVLDNVFNINTVFGIFMQGFIAGIVGIIVCVVMLKYLKNAEVEQVWKTLHSKIWKSEVLVSGQEQL